MKWEGRWWGIRIIAENDDDAIMLMELSQKIPAKAASSYEDGEVRHEMDDTGNHVQLVFER